jgi:uncharacterized membrane protein YhaH (DUF805 family)
MSTALFGFEGRMGRGGWWFAQLVMLIITGLLIGAALVLHDPARSAENNNDFAMIAIAAVCIIAIVVVNVSSTVKRFHDRGKSGWWFWISFVPLIGGPWVLIECGMLPGEDGDNDYGAPPGAAHRMAALADEVAGMNSKGNQKFDKIDDTYLSNYAQKLATAQPQASPASSAPSFGQAAGKPVFGKR